MVKAKIFSSTTVNALNFKNKKIKIITNQVLKKKNLFLSWLVNDYILMYLETTIFCIYNFFSTI